MTNLAVMAKPKVKFILTKRKSKELISYCSAINQAIDEEMALDKSVFVIGGETKMFGSLAGLEEKYGVERVITTPISEDATTGLVLGAALSGLRPIQVHIRVDFLLLAVNQVINMISTATFASDGKVKCPILIRAVVGRGWGQGYQHSKSLHGLFAQIPGLKLIMPTTPNDAKGMIKQAIKINSPVICLEHRWLYWQEEELLNDFSGIDYGVPGKIQSGSDVTVIASSWMNVEASLAAKILSDKHDISVDLFDIRSTESLNNLREVYDSVRKTGRCIIGDNDWLSSGLSGEIAYHIQKNCLGDLTTSIERVGFKETPCGTARHLEDEFYPNAFDIVRCVEKMVGVDPCAVEEYKLFSHETKFKGPF